MTDRVHLPHATVDLARRVVECGTSRVRLTTLETELLACLAAHPGETLSREALMAEVWQRKVAERTIDTTVRRLRAKVELDPGDPVHILAVQGVGYRFESGPRRLSTWPRFPQALRGRDPEVDALATALSAPAGCITVLGAPGIGKTRLAAELAGRESSTHEVTWVSLCTASTSAAAVAQVARVLGVQGDTVSGTIASVGRGLGARGRALLVLDSVEHLDADFADAVARWASAARVLVTSRVPLRILGERHLRIGALSVPAAVALYRDAATLSSPAVEEEAVSTLVQALGCNPLAIELAAARSAVLAPTQMLDRMDRLFDVLERSDRTPLTDAITVSWSLLRPGERTVLAQLAAFPDGATLEALEACVPDSSTDHHVQEAVERLVEHSLVGVEPHCEMRRFVPFRMVREFVRLVQSPERRVEHTHRAGAWLAARSRAWRKAIDGPVPRPAMLALERERGNLHHIALQIMEDRPADAAALWIALSAGPPGPSHPRDIARHMLDQALACVERLDDVALEVDVRVRRSVILRELGSYDEAEREARQARSLAEDGAPDLIARAEIVVAAVLRFVRRAEAAAAALDRAAARTCDGQMRADIAMERAMLAIGRADLAAADREVGAALGHIGQDSRYTWIRLHQLRGEIRLSAGDLGGATRAFERVEHDLEAAGLGHVGRSRHLMLLGEVAHARGQVDNARRLLTEGQLRAHREGNRPLGLAASLDLGMLAHELGEFSVAEEHYLAALEPGHGQYCALYGCGLLALVRASGPLCNAAPGLLARSWSLAGSSRSARAFVGLAEALVDLALATGDGEPQRAVVRERIRQLYEPSPADPELPPLPPLASIDHDLRVLIRIAERHLRAAVGALG